MDVPEDLGGVEEDLFFTRLGRYVLNGCPYQGTVLGEWSAVARTQLLVALEVDTVVLSYREDALATGKSPLYCRERRCCTFPPESRYPVLEEFLQDLVFAVEPEPCLGEDWTLDEP